MQMTITQKESKFGFIRGFRLKWPLHKVGWNRLDFKYLFPSYDSFPSLAHSSTSTKHVFYWKRGKHSFKDIIRQFGYSSLHSIL